MSSDALPDREIERAPRSLPMLVVFSLAALAVIAGFVALGIWQVERLGWKHDLIARVDARIHATPVPAPGPAEWSGLTAEADEYRRVMVRGALSNDQATLVQAATERGGGFWVMTPVVTDRGFTVLVNRGFVPPQSRTRGGYVEPSGPVTIVALLRISEPKGGFLRSNDPAADRWYSRDVDAIAGARKLGSVAPYFIDAEATGNRNRSSLDGATSSADTLPVAGMTVVRFPDHHLSYALTWFALAALALGGYLQFMRWEFLLRRKRGG